MQLFFFCIQLFVSPSQSNFPRPFIIDLSLKKKSFSMYSSCFSDYVIVTNLSLSHTHTHTSLLYISVSSSQQNERVQTKTKENDNKTKKTKKNKRKTNEIIQTNLFKKKQTKLTPLLFSIIIDWTGIITRFSVRFRPHQSGQTDNQTWNESQLNRPSPTTISTQQYDN